MVLLTGFVVPLLVAVSQLQRLNPAALPRLGVWLALAALALAALIVAAAPVPRAAAGARRCCASRRSGAPM